MTLSCQLCKKEIVDEQPTGKLLKCHHYVIAHRECSRTLQCPRCTAEKDGHCSTAVCHVSQNGNHDVTQSDHSDVAAGEVIALRQACKDLKDEVKQLQTLLKTSLGLGKSLTFHDGSMEQIHLSPCSKLFVGPADIRSHVEACARLHVDFLPESELKLPRFMEVAPFDIEEALPHICPGGKLRLNLATVFRRFEEEPGTVLRQWTPLKELVSWSALQGRFEYVLEHFVRHLPCGADKTISQVLTALFERGRSNTEHSRCPLNNSTYLMGVLRHKATAPFMPFGLWTHAAVFGFSPSVENNASKWLQSLLSNNKLVVRQGSFANSEHAAPPCSQNMQEAPEEEIDVAIAAGGGSDVVTASAWLAHIGALKDSLVFHPGRGKPEEFGRSPDDLLVSVPDFTEPLSKGTQFYEGTDLLARTQHLAKSLGLDYNYFFLLQDKNILGSGSAEQVLDHMNALASSIAEAVKRFGRCRRIHIVDSGGDVLTTVLQACGVTGAEDLVNPRKERDVWNLLLALALQERFDCQVQLVVVAPGIDGQSVWVGPEPRMA